MGIITAAAVIGRIKNKRAPNRPLYFYEGAVFLLFLTARGLFLVFNRLPTQGASKAGAAFIIGICLFLFAVPPFQIKQVKSASERVEQLFDPMNKVLQDPPEKGSWVILKDKAPSFKANYMGAVPSWMTGGLRFLDGNQGDPQKLKARYPNQKIYRLKENNVLEEVE